MTLHHQLGAWPLGDGSTRFRVWAPNQQSIEVHFPDSGRVELMERDTAAYHLATLPNVAAGEHYFYRLGGSIDRPDPVSRFQPGGVHGPSQVVDPHFDWTDRAWSGLAVGDLVIYELHIGTFTDAGTFAGAAGRLDELVELGVTAIELMPLAAAPGRWNWGYDGVNLFAPNQNYGTPQELKRLVDTAHAKGLAVILDVVYNHFGPEGNYLADFGPYLSSRHHTPWGPGPNFDDPTTAEPVRQFVIANAIYWFEEYHFDALRVDAIHCMKDDGDRHVVVDISAAVDRWRTQTGRPAALIAESNVYDSRMLQSRDHGGIGFDAAWCDDFLHSLFAVLRPGEQLSDRAYRSSTDLEQTLRYGYVYAGSMQETPQRQRLAARVETDRLVYCIQNHDFIGNHPLGQRFHQLTSRNSQMAAAALLMLYPAIPMLFMGEEFACEHPFRFFVDFGDEHLRRAVVAGRRREYPQHDWASGLSPTDIRTFTESKIGPAHEGDPCMRSWYQSLIRLRKRWIAMGLLHDSNLSIETDTSSGLFVLRYDSGSMEATVATRLSGAPEPHDAIPWTPRGNIVLDSRPQRSEAVELLANHAKIATYR